MLLKKLRSKRGEYTIGFALAMALIALGHVQYERGKWGKGGEDAVYSDWKTAWYQDLNPVNGSKTSNRK